MEVGTVVGVVGSLFITLLVILWQMSRLETRISDRTRSTLDTAEARLGDKISQEVRHTLQNLFQPIQKRGAIGEAILREILKDILPIEKFETQYALNGGRVDAIVKLERGIIPIDSKFPFDNYLQIINAENENERSILR